MEKIVLVSGAEVELGTYKCTKCGAEIKFDEKSKLPGCPNCGNDQWTKSKDKLVLDPVY